MVADHAWVVEDEDHNHSSHDQCFLQGGSSRFSAEIEKREESPSTTFWFIHKVVAQTPDSAIRPTWERVIDARESSVLLPL